MASPSSSLYGRLRHAAAVFVQRCNQTRAAELRAKKAPAVASFKASLEQRTAEEHAAAKELLELAAAVSKARAKKNPDDPVGQRQGVQS